MNKILKIALIVLIALFLSGAVLLYLFFKNKDKDIIKTYGNIEIRQVDLSFQVSGRIKDVFVEEGDFVQKGQLLAQLDDRDYIANYKKALADSLISKAQKREDTLKYQRNHPLCKDGTISKEYCETLFNNKSSSIANYAQKEANLSYQKNQLDYTKLYAPQKGIISTRAQEKGAQVQQGQIIYVMNLTEPIWVRTYIKENELGNIKYGQCAKILTDTVDPKTNKKKEYDGFIGYISPVSEFSPKTVQSEDLRADLVYRIRVYITQTDEFIRQGMPVSVIIPLKENKEKKNGTISKLN